MRKKGEVYYIINVQRCVGKCRIVGTNEIVDNYENWHRYSGFKNISEVALFIKKSRKLDKITGDKCYYEIYNEHGQDVATLYPDHIFMRIVHDHRSYTNYLYNI